jgi:hypothetical protein
MAEKHNLAKTWEISIWGKRRLNPVSAKRRLRKRLNSVNLVPVADFVDLVPFALREREQPPEIVR